MPALSFSHVTKRYGSLCALDDVSLTIQKGEFFGLLGPNGAGKTTLISIVAGLVRADKGDVSVLGHDVITDYAKARKNLGVVPQELVFDPFFTVRETLKIQSGYFGLSRNDDWIDEVMHHLDLTDKANTNMRALSGGMKRRVLVAQALVHKPPVIVLDEPTAGVDVELRHTLWKFIARLNQENHTIVLTTHYLEEAQNFCTRLALLNHGKIVAVDHTQALLNQMAQKTLTITFEGNLPQGLSPLSLLNQRATFAIEDADAALEIVAKFNEFGTKIVDLETSSPKLDDVFLKLLERQ